MAYLNWTLTDRNYCGRHTGRNEKLIRNADTQNNLYDQVGEAMK